VIEHLGTAMTFVAGVAGVAAGYGVLRNQAGNNKRRITEVEVQLDQLTGRNPGGEPQWTRRGECAERHKEIREQLKEQNKIIRALQRFAHWKMTRDGAELSEINKTLNGD